MLSTNFSFKEAIILLGMKFMSYLTVTTLIANRQKEWAISIVCYQMSMTLFLEIVINEIIFYYHILIYFFYKSSLIAICVVS